ncbi:MAG TPA: dihydrofolate reductase family protein [Candidatus Limnocylindrales bacterium]|nr:dihydrofolate reductase family protein [Candidatus Limnocylindrales bacterium]
MARKVVASTYITLDGFIDEPGRWSFPFWSEEASQFKAQELFASDALLLGRITYEGFAAAWPTMEGTGAFGEKMNGMPKYVASRTLTSASWNATVIEGDVADAVRALKATDGGDLLIGGSGQLVDFLTWHNLIDEYRLMVYPLVLGDGTKRLFTTVRNQAFELTASLGLPNGVMVLTYRRAA